MTYAKAVLPPLSAAALGKLGALVVRADELVDEVYFAAGFPTQRLQSALRAVRDLLSDHELMAFKLALDREGLLPERKP